MKTGFAMQLSRRGVGVFLFGEFDVALSLEVILELLFRSNGTAKKILDLNLDSLGGLWRQAW